MSGEATTRLGLPMIAPGQAAKELTHNEALSLLDLVVQARVIAIGLGEPPAAPQEGEAWIVGSSPTGAWTGHADAIAGWTLGGWRYVAAREGIRVWISGSELEACYRGGAWRVGEGRVARVTIGGKAVVGPRAAAVATPQGGATIDSEVRGAVAGILAALRTHGLIDT